MLCLVNLCSFWSSNLFTARVVKDMLAVGLIAVCIRMSCQCLHRAAHMVLASVKHGQFTGLCICACGATLLISYPAMQNARDQVECVTSDMTPEAELSHQDLAGKQASSQKVFKFEPGCCTHAPTLTLITHNPWSRHHSSGCIARLPLCAPQHSFCPSCQVVARVLTTIVCNSCSWCSLITTHESGQLLQCPCFCPCCQILARVLTTNVCNSYS